MGVIAKLDRIVRRHVAKHGVMPDNLYLTTKEIAQYFDEIDGICVARHIQTYIVDPLQFRGIEIKARKS